ncbi:MAG: hypothetical protein ACK5MN_03405 [Lachnospiraceae bacterium]
MYKVVYKFYDKQDGNKIYKVGDEYTGKVTKTRLAQLTTTKNDIGKVLIEKVEDPQE